MVLCSKASRGSCCQDDRTKHIAWKYGYGDSEVTLGSSCQDARINFCKAQGTYGTKYCPINNPVPTADHPPAKVKVTQPTTTSETDPYGRAPASQIQPQATIKRNLLDTTRDPQATINRGLIKANPTKFNATTPLTTSDTDPYGRAPKPTKTNNQPNPTNNGMVRCSVAQAGTCCSEDRTGKPAWKYSKSNIYIGSSCADARQAYCQNSGTFGSKYCPGSSGKGRTLNQPGARLTPQTDPYRNPKSSIQTPAKVVYPRPVQLQSRRQVLQNIADQRAAAEFPSGASAPSGGGGSTPRGTNPPAPKDESILTQLCPYFSWMDFISKDCRVQVLGGAALVVAVLAIGSRVIR